MTKKQKKGLLERLQQGVVLGAEGYVFELERRGYLRAGAYVPEVVLEHPEVVTQLHREFVRAGSDVVEALTYYAHHEKLKLIGREGDLEKLNRTALRLAKEVADESGTLLAGNICNTWAYDSENVEESSKEVERQYTEQLQWAAEEGVDFIIAETIEYLGEALIALKVAKKFNLPVIVNLAPVWQQSKDGFDWIEACQVLKEAGADVVGFNCARGPTTMLPLLRDLRQAVDGPIAALPVPYHTTEQYPAFEFLKNPDGSSAYTIGLEKFLCDRDEMALFAKQAQEIGVAYIGICCGAGPHHVRAMAEALGRTTEASKYSPDFSQHSMFGTDDFVRDSQKEFQSQLT